MTLRWLWSLHSDLENLLKLSRALYRHLIGMTESVVRVPETARITDPEAAREIAVEQVTSDIADEWYSRSKWPDPE